MLATFLFEWLSNWEGLLSLPFRAHFTLIVFIVDHPHHLILICEGECSSSSLVVVGTSSFGALLFVASNFGFFDSISHSLVTTCHCISYLLRCCLPCLSAEKRAGCLSEITIQLVVCRILELLLSSLLVQSLGRLVGPLRHWSYSNDTRFNILKWRPSIVHEALFASLLMLSQESRAFVIGGEDLRVRAWGWTQARRQHA